jgi:hypothetical protein
MKYYTCYKCKHDVNQHNFWIAGNKKYHFDCLPQKRKDELALEGYTHDNGNFLMGLLDATNEHGQDTVMPALKALTGLAKNANI